MAKEVVQEREIEMDRLRSVIVRLARSLRKTHAGADYTTTETSVLASVVRNGPVGLSKLASNEGMNPTMLSRVVRRLEEGGLVLRVADPLDARVGIVSATPPGQHLHEQMRIERNDYLNHLVEQLDVNDRQALAEALPVLEQFALRTERTSLMRSRAHLIFQEMFSSLKVPNYRLYFTGQSISMAGTWVQMTAQAWLVLTLTHSSTDLGFIVAIQTLPVLLLGPYGGVIADRVDKRRLMVALQIAMGVQALLLGLLTVFGTVRFWEICVLAAVLGANNAFENPSRQAFVREMVGMKDLRNAITLNSVTINVARAVGPAIAGILIATVGDGVCFLINAGSFVAVVASLMVMDRSALRPSARNARERGQFHDGLRYASRTPEIAIPLFMMAFVGMIAYEFQVSLPVFARQTFHGGSEAYGFMTAASGVGAVIGGLFTAARGRTGLRPMIVAAIGFGTAILLVSAAPFLALVFVILLFVGWASVSFISIGNSTIQTAASPEMRGRVLSFWQVAFQGTTPIGGPLVGWIIAESNPRIGLEVGGVSCFLAAIGGLLLARRFHVPVRMRRKRAVAEPTDDPTALTV